MKTSEIKLGELLRSRLDAFDKKEHPLPGITEEGNRNAFVDQLIDSIRRVRYIRVMQERDISPHRLDPSSSIFDPLKAASIHRLNGNIDEAFWLVFLATHCGKNGTTGWRLARDIYGRLQQGEPWTWVNVSTNTQEFCNWIVAAYDTLKGGDGVRRMFSNHRKYETLRPDSLRSPSRVVSSYVDWVGPDKSHEALVQQGKQKTDGDPRSVFNYLYRSMNSVVSFGRTGRFDYLTMIGKMNLANIEADSAYMAGATGPKDGGALLFKGYPEARISTNELDALFLRIGTYLEVGPQAMQVMEDAICNWQKSPSKYQRFRG